MINTEVSYAAGLSKSQVSIAERVAKVAYENYDTYKVLPSLAVTQACQESSLGDHCAGNNLWGIKSGGESYSSIEDGTLRYLQVINNGLYDKAVGNLDFYSSIQSILNGGYCVGDPNYVSNCIWLYERYNFGKYDKKVFQKIKEEKLKEKKRREKERKEKEETKREEYIASEDWVVKYDPEVPQNAVRICSKYVKSGTITIYENMELKGIYDVELTDDDEGRVIYSSNILYADHIVQLESEEEAKG